MVDFLISAGVIIVFILGVVLYITHLLDVPHIQRDPLGGGFYITENGRRALRGEPPAPGFFARLAAKKQEKLQAETAQSQAKLVTLQEELAQTHSYTEKEDEELDDYYEEEEDENDPEVKRLYAEAELECQIIALKQILQEPFAQAQEDYAYWQEAAAEDTPPIFWEDFSTVKKHFADTGDYESLTSMQSKESEYLHLKQQVHALLYPDSALAKTTPAPPRSMPPPLPPLNRY